MISTMDNDLGLGVLTDDQLLELGLAVLREIAGRAPETQEFMRQTLLDERDRLMAAQDGTAIAIATERNRQREQIARAAHDYAGKKLAIERDQFDAQQAALASKQTAELRALEWRPLAIVAAMVNRLFGNGWTIEKWTHGSDVRIYLSGPDCDFQITSHGRKKIGSYIEYYVTGNDKHPPGKLVMRGVKAPRNAVAVLCAHINASRISVMKCDDVAHININQSDFPDDFTDIQQQR